MSRFSRHTFLASGWGRTSQDATPPTGWNGDLATNLQVRGAGSGAWCLERAEQLGGARRRLGCVLLGAYRPCP